MCFARQYIGKWIRKTKGPVVEFGYLIFTAHAIFTGKQIGKAAPYLRWQLTRPGQSDLPSYSDIIGFQGIQCDTSELRWKSFKSDRRNCLFLQEPVGRLPSQRKEAGWSNHRDREVATFRVFSGLCRLLREPLSGGRVTSEATY